ncbi:hypothetical protein B0H16DRAFT_1474063 [Mycena metata]|uniref:Uncharacterized protein n=1 Tax=Mycena metata TaxID=1033252 RepID=A0AAD7HHV9_9AGAR|nr:hypothetical protein B0H16DRAFT_1474063 [Mycena metata]
MYSILTCLRRWATRISFEAGANVEQHDEGMDSWEREAMGLADRGTGEVADTGFEAEMQKSSASKEEAGCRRGRGGSLNRLEGSAPNRIEHMRDGDVVDAGAGNREEEPRQTHMFGIHRAAVQRVRVESQNLPPASVYIRDDFCSRTRVGFIAASIFGPKGPGRVWRLNIAVVVDGKHECGNDACHPEFTRPSLALNIHVGFPWLRSCDTWPQAASQMVYADISFPISRYSPAEYLHFKLRCAFFHFVEHKLTAAYVATCFPMNEVLPSVVRNIPRVRAVLVFLPNLLTTKAGHKTDPEHTAREHANECAETPGSTPGWVMQSRSDSSIAPSDRVTPYLAVVEYLLRERTGNNTDSEHTHLFPRAYNLPAYASQRKARPRSAGLPPPGRSDDSGSKFAFQMNQDITPDPEYTRHLVRLQAGSLHVGTNCVETLHFLDNTRSAFRRSSEEIPFREKEAISS